MSLPSSISKLSFPPIWLVVEAKVELQQRITLFKKKKKKKKNTGSSMI